MTLLSLWRQKPRPPYFKLSEAVLTLLSLTSLDIRQPCSFTIVEPKISLILPQLRHSL